MFPILFTIGPFAVSTMWVFILASVYIFTRILVKNLHKKRDDFKFIYNEIISLLIILIVGARIGYVAQNLSAFTEGFYGFLHIFAIWDNGFSFITGLIFMLIALYFKTKEYEESFKKWLDNLTEAYLYITPLIAIGKFFDGVAYGAKTDLPIGISFNNMNVAIMTPVHPTQIYSALLLTMSILLTRYYFKKYPDRAVIDGSKASLIIGLIAISTFIEELFRGDPTIEIYGIRFAIIGSLIISLLSLRFHSKIINHKANK